MAHGFTDNVYKNVSNNAVFYYSSCYGGMISIIFVGFIFCHIMYHYIHIFHGKEPSTQDKTQYILFLILCILVLFIGVQFAFVRTNILSKQSTESITLLQCRVGYYGAYGATMVVLTLIFVLLLQRIRQSFKGSAYQYPNKLYLFLYVSLFIMNIVPYSSLPINYSNTIFELEYIHTKDQIYCASIGKAGSYKEELEQIAVIVYIFNLVLYDIIILYMFTKRLHQLKTHLVASHIEETQKIGNKSQVVAQPSKAEVIPDQSYAAAPSVSPDIEMNAKLPQHPSLTVGDITKEMNSESAFNKNSAKRIYELHTLIKQHTILIFLVVLHSILWVVLVTGVSSDAFYPQQINLHLVNIVCLWLMFRVSHKYFICTTKYFICWICYCPYCDDKKDINACSCLF